MRWETPGEGGALGGAVVLTWKPWSVEVRGVSTGCKQVGVAFGHPAL